MCEVQLAVLQWRRQDAEVGGKVEGVWRAEVPQRRVRGVAQVEIWGMQKS